MCLTYVTGKTADRKKKQGLCLVVGCKNKRYAKKRYLICITCNSRNVSSKRPEARTYRNLKSNAKHRRKHFSLTFDEFKEFCAETNYMELKGRSADAMTIDCIVAELGYRKGNIQIMTKRDNSSKGTKFVEYPIGDLPKKQIIEEIQPF